MSTTTVFVIEEHAGGFRLLEVSADDFAADSWHPTLEAAQADAKAASTRITGTQLTPWRAVPVEVADPIEFARTKCAH